MTREDLVDRVGALVRLGLFCWAEMEDGTPAVRLTEKGKRAYEDGTARDMIYQQAVADYAQENGGHA